jgi:hypothetical protein
MNERHTEGRSLQSQFAASLAGHLVAGRGRVSIGISWVTLERWAREKAGPPGAGRNRSFREDARRLSDAQLLEKLRCFGIALDRGGLAALGQGAYSAQEVASQLTSRHLTEEQTRTLESDWVWLAVLTLWQRWWPGNLGSAGNWVFSETPRMNPQVSVSRLAETRKMT